MNILITNIWLENRGGTEVFVRDLSFALKDKGHHVEVYSPRIGLLAEEISAYGIHVTNDPEQLVTEPDIIHAHHYLPCMEVMSRFKSCPAIYFVHDYSFNGDIPPNSNRIIKYIAVDELCLQKLLVQFQIPSEKTLVLHNWVDTKRFANRELVNSLPKKALVFSNYAKPDNHYKIIDAACRSAGMEIDALGFGFKNSIADPENILPNYDIVFAKGKSAMEAMASGAAVVVCDFRGLAGMVSTSNFDYFRKYNFGMKTMDKEIRIDTLMQELSKYDPFDCSSVTERIREEASFDRYLNSIQSIYSEIISRGNSSEYEIDSLVEKAIIITFKLGQQANKVHIDHLEHRIGSLTRSLKNSNQEKMNLMQQKKKIEEELEKNKLENDHLRNSIRELTEELESLNEKTKNDFWKRIFR